MSPANSNWKERATAPKYNITLMSFQEGAHYFSYDSIYYHPEAHHPPLLRHIKDHQLGHPSRDRSTAESRESSDNGFGKSSVAENSVKAFRYLTINFHVNECPMSSQAAISSTQTPDPSSQRLQVMLRPNFLSAGTHQKLVRLQRRRGRDASLSAQATYHLRSP